jgi:hypothetical protein
MKLPITIEYSSGEQATYIAQPPEWARWEKQTGNTIGQAQDKMGISDLMFLAYYAHKREAGGKPVKPYDAWVETITDVVVGDASPKATQQEA